MKRFLLFVLAVCLAVGSAGELFAKGGGSRSGGSFRSSSSSSKSWSSSKPSTNSSWSSSKPASSRPSPTSATATTTKQKADQAAYKTAVQSGTAFKTKSAAQADFKQKYATQYTSKYTSEPTTRPSHIPQTYKTTDGKTVNITYNQNSGGYGYWSGGGPGIGTFLMYDMMTDAIMMDAMMSQHHYHVGGPPAVIHTRDPSQVFIGFLVAVAVVLCVIGFFYWISGAT